MTRSVRFAAALLAVAVSTQTARAFDQTAPETVSKALATTNWSDHLVFDQFNPVLGTLTGVQITLTEHAQGSAGYENLSSVSVPVTMSLAVAVSATLPSGTTPLTISVQLVKSSDTAGPNDGKLDFGGTSGKTYTNSADATPIMSTLTGSALTPFQGFGTISIPISATGLSSATGPGNVATKFSSDASATGTIVYLFTPGGATPEPTSLALIGVGGVILLAARGRRRRLAA